MNITMRTINNVKIEIQNIREMLETNDGMLIFVPKCGTVPIIADGVPLIYSELPSVDKRAITSLSIGIH